MKIKYLMKFFEGLPGIQAHSGISCPRGPYLGAGHFFRYIRRANISQIAEKKVSLDRK